MVPSVAASLDSDTFFGEFLLFFAEKSSTGRPIWEEEDDQDNTRRRDNAFNDEEPSKALKATCAINLPNSIGDGSAESACEGSVRNDE